MAIQYNPGISYTGDQSIRQAGLLASRAVSEGFASYFERKRADELHQEQLADKAKEEAKEAKEYSTMVRAAAKESPDTVWPLLNTTPEQFDNWSAGDKIAAGRGLVRGATLMAQQQLAQVRLQAERQATEQAAKINPLQEQDLRARIEAMVGDRQQKADFNRRMAGYANTPAQIQNPDVRSVALQNLAASGMLDARNVDALAPQGTATPGQVTEVPGVPGMFYGVQSPSGAGSFFPGPKTQPTPTPKAPAGRMQIKDADGNTTTVDLTAEEIADIKARRQAQLANPAPAVPAKVQARLDYLRQQVAKGKGASKDLMQFGGATHEQELAALEKQYGGGRAPASAPASQTPRPLPKTRDQLVAGSLYQTNKGRARWNGHAFEALQ